MNLLFTLVGIFYLLNGIFYLIGIRRSRNAQSKSHVELFDYPFVTVIVPARDEAAVIESCLDALLNQDYPREQFEVLLVNDRSADSTGKIIAAYANQHPGTITPVQLSGAFGGKGLAIDTGVKLARGDIILTTDADVRVNPNWIRTIAEQFQPATGLVFGPTMYRYNNKLVQRYQALETAFLSVVSSGYVANEFPVTCQGSNMAFRKETYQEIRDKLVKRNFPDTNDDLILQEVSLLERWKIRTVLTSGAINYTDPPETWLTLMNQRFRWASHGRLYPRISVRIYLILLFSSLLGFAAGPFVLPVNQVITLWGLKLMVDFSVALEVTSAIRDRKLLKAFPLVFLLQPFIVVVSGIFGTLGLFRWK